MKLKLIVGLGNPGVQYNNTKHNYGFMVLDRFAEHLEVEFSREKFKGVYYKFADFIIAKPKTYMNLSGEFIRDICNFYNISEDDILVVYDDIDLDFGKAMLKVKGSDANHNGIKNIMELMGLTSLNRLKLGSGRNKKLDLKTDVLSKFSETQVAEIDLLSTTYIDAINCFIYNDIYTAMNMYNNKLRGK